MTSLYRLETLVFNNFKLFGEKFTVNFNGNELVVFDGPNGYGKTTIYDAVELALTGDIRRLANIESRQNPSDVVVAYNNNTDCFVRLKIKNGENTIEIERRLKNPTPKDARKIINFKKLWDLFLIQEEGERQITQSLLNELVDSQNLQRDFTLFHYVEQEDTAHFLKSKTETDRAKALSVLFGDTVEMQEAVSKVEQIEKRINEILRTKIRERNVLEQRGSIKVSAGDEISNVKYKPLLEWKLNQFEWDQEAISVLPVEKRDSFLSEIQKLKILVEHRTFFLSKRTYIRASEQHDVLQGFIAYSHYLPKLEELKENLRKSILVEKVSSILGVDKFDELLVEPSLAEVFSLVNYGFREEFLDELKKIVEGRLRNESSSKLVLELLDHRNNLRAYLDKQENKKDCLFCGSSFDEEAQLIDAIDQKESALKSVLSDDARRVHGLQDSFLTDKIRTFSNILAQYSSVLVPTTKEHVLELERAQQLNERFEKLKRWLNEEGVEYLDLLLNYKPENNSVTEIELNVGLLRDRMLEKIQVSPSGYDDANEESDLESVFSVYFDSNPKLLNAIDYDSVLAKSQYIRQLYLESISSDIKSYGVLKFEISQIELKKAAIRKLRGNLKKSISRFQKRLIKDIEIPFYIYSGKVLQSHQSDIGNGIFIKDKTGGDELRNIRFVANWDSDHDVLNTMSSGQIAAIVITLYLALNKVYSQGLGVILIDDPVQTMDEINMISLVELLRNEFSDRQIILSTHEDHVARYFLYKFLKYQRSVRQVKLIDRKEYQLSN
ncbi:MAG: AAA family ATPase [Gammaproteobacteria bacterium]|nr:AAA family ATPase [Gammaproteobacteria bacterium]MCF6261311.1 AAA family ATPase [Gammaproteobacteria bacterium]